MVGAETETKCVAPILVTSRSGASSGDDFLHGRRHRALAHAKLNRDFVGEALLVGDETDDAALGAEVFDGTGDDLECFVVESAEALVEKHAVMSEVLGLDQTRIADLRAAGAFGRTENP